MTRITNAGGFVNQFGRVNGNLNLSRSIGDLKYKQVPGIPPAEQMITAEPDILRWDTVNDGLNPTIRSLLLARLLTRISFFNIALLLGKKMNSLFWVVMVSGTAWQMKNVSNMCMIVSTQSNLMKLV